MQHKKYKKVVLVILDGFGVAPAGHGNAITQAEIPTFNSFVSNYPSLTLQASGPLVGLPWGEMGNSEVRHLNIGAGRIVGQDLPRITNAIQNGDFFKNSEFLAAISHSKQNNSSLHIMGMISPGGVHSLDEHVYALLSLAQQQGLTRVFIHMFTDGRDTEPKVALESLKKLNEKILEIGVGRVATITGRFYAMDRGGHWNQTAQTYNALVKGEGKTSHSPEACIESSYASQVFDEMIEPTVILREDGQPVAKISDNDAVVFINFRSDRAIQLTEAFVMPPPLPDKALERPLQNLYFVTMTEYKPGLPVHVAFPSINLKNYLSEILAESKYTQFHVAESEKYAHVTAFFNCGRTERALGEEWTIVTSPENGRNYVDHPEMSAGKLTDALVDKIAKTETNFFVANYANPDMVGHTGSLAATIEAVSFIDKCMKRVADAAMAADAAMIITADHGNAEQMINTRTGDIDKDHTTNPVPFLLLANEFKFKRAAGGSFASLSSKVPAGVVSDIAPTVLELFGLDKPNEMTGVSLLGSFDEIPVKN